LAIINLVRDASEFSLILARRFNCKSPPKPSLQALKTGIQRHLSAIFPQKSDQKKMGLKLFNSLSTIYINI